MSSWDHTKKNKGEQSLGVVATHGKRVFEADLYGNLAADVYAKEGRPSVVSKSAAGTATLGIRKWSSHVVFQITLKARPHSPA